MDPFLSDSFSFILLCMIAYEFLWHHTASIPLHCAVFSSWNLTLLNVYLNWIWYCGELCDDINFRWMQHMRWKITALAAMKSLFVFVLYQYELCESNYFIPICIPKGKMRYGKIAENGCVCERERGRERKILIHSVDTCCFKYRPHAALSL